jgi:hypothetical protein
MGDRAVGRRASSKGESTAVGEQPTKPCHGCRVGSGLSSWEYRVKKLLIAILAATTLAPSLSAQPYGDNRHDRGFNQGPRDRGDRGNRADWRRYREYDYNRPGQGGAYMADRYYRDGRYYKERRLGRNDRIYRGSNGRYYCRRNDGTTGLIIGGVAGGLLGNALDNGNSSLLGTLLGAGGGALLGREVDRGSVRCR